MRNNPRYNQTTRHNIKRAVRMPISEARKIFKSILGAKTQLTYLSLLAGLMVVLMFSAPLLSVAQQQNPAVVKAITEGEFNATTQTSRLAWFALGVIGGPITVLVTAAQEPSPPPADLLLGKAPKYIEVFTEAYKAKAKNLRFTYATIGCVTGVTLGSLGCTVYDYQQYGNWWWETW